MGNKYGAGCNKVMIDLMWWLILKIVEGIISYGTLPR